MAGLPEDRPDGNLLLDVARRVLLEELLPLLPEDRRLDGLMIANAMGIAFAGFWGSLIVSAVGAILLLAILGMFRRRPL